MSSFFDRVFFLRAYHEADLVGFVKLVQGEGSRTMQIISKLSERDKASTITDRQGC